MEQQLSSMDQKKGQKIQKSKIKDSLIIGVDIPMRDFVVMIVSWIRKQDLTDEQKVKAIAGADDLIHGIDEVCGVREIVGTLKHNLPIPFGLNNKIQKGNK